MSQRILVVGGTGMLGEPVARQLGHDGFAVRILSRTPEEARKRFGADFEVVGGDMFDADALRAALDQCTGVHINLNGGPTGDYDRIEHQGSTAIAEAAAAAGVERLTYLSGISAREENRFNPSSAAKVDAGAAIRRSGVPYTIFRATWFFESLPFFVQGGRAAILGSQPNPLRWLAAGDYAGMVARAYNVPESANKEFDILGPEPMTMLEALRRYCAVHHPDLEPKSVPFWQAEIAARVPGNEALRGVIPMMKFFEKFVENGDSEEADRLLGAPRTTLEQWLQTH